MQPALLLITHSGRDRKKDSQGPTGSLIQPCEEAAVAGDG